MVRDILCRIGDLHIEYLCDLYEDRIDWMSVAVEERCGYRPKTTTDYHELIAALSVKVIINYAARKTHVPVAIAAMKAWTGWYIRPFLTFCVRTRTKCQWMSTILPHGWLSRHSVKLRSLSDRLWWKCRTSPMVLGVPDLHTTWRRGYK